MEQEFQRVILVVLAVGSIIATIGASAVFLMLRAYGGENAGGSSHLVSAVALIVFVMICCLALFALSYAGR